MILKNFKKEELECPCCKKCEVREEAGQKLQKLRDKLGFPLPIASAFRCEQKNRAIKGATGSKHLLGSAFDIKTSGMNSRHRYELLREGVKLFKGVGVYNRHIHLDDREVGAMWVGKSK